ncbi:hypothetical protein M8C21_011228 [Ambrosia artemisiifolia]|uniref:Uncharacterized protein n=1 Tax=Ambrosia artemisiifolia TaxID=4212 RepID=A0AAD5C8Z7_AMBAR|nr:hypothetical protein M8C21_011228 [Ambrosia artemisiifolia]
MPMDVCSEIGLSATDTNSDHHGSCKNSMNTFGSTHGVLKARSVDELSVYVTELLNIQDTTEDDSTSSTSHKRSEFEEKDSCDEFLLSKTVIQAPEKCLHKHATFPSSGKTLSPQGGITSELSTHGDNIKSSDPSGFRSISLPSRILVIQQMTVGDGVDVYELEGFFCKAKQDWGGGVRAPSGLGRQTHRALHSLEF